MGSAEFQGELWGQAARDWAELQEPMHEPLWKAMLDAGNIGKGATVCDIGCGGGGLSHLAAKRMALVAGLDASEALIEIARDRTPGGDFRVGEMEELPFADNRFDTVFAANALQYSENRINALHEMRRVCASAGRIAIGLWGPQEKVEFRSVFRAVIGTLPEPPPGKGPFELSGPGVLARLCEEAGMHVIEEGEVQCPFSYEDFALFWKANAAGGPMRAAMRRVGEEKLIESVRSAVRPWQKTDGSMTFNNTFQYLVAVPRG